MIKKLDDKIHTVLDRIMTELGMNIDNVKNIDITDNIDYEPFNTFEYFKDRNDYIIDFTFLYNAIPIIKTLESIYDIDLPTEYPLGSITKEVIDTAITIKTIFYNWILSIYIPEIFWESGSPIIHVPSVYFAKDIEKDGE